MEFCGVKSILNTTGTQLRYFLYAHDRYDIALLYLEQAEYDLDAAVNTYLTDELWETEHPLAPSPGGNTKQKLSGRRLVVKFGVSS